MTRAVIADTLGPIGNYALRGYDPGAPGPGEVRIAIAAAGVSFADVLVASGEYQVKPPVPFIPGSECSGVIEAVGEGVPASRVGERVQTSRMGGIFAEAVVVPAATARPIPERLSFAEGAVFVVSYATSYHALVQRAQLQPGETLLVLGAGGAVGYAAIQLGKQLGARVIGSASSEDKRALALRGGADAAVDSRSASWRDDVKAANDGRPVDVVFDPLGGAATEPAFRSLAWRGRHLVIGFAAGGIPKLPTNLALLKGAALLGADIRQFGIYEPELYNSNMRALMALAAEGRVAPPIAKSYRLGDFAEAMRETAAGMTAGRIVIEIS